MRLDSALRDLNVFSSRNKAKEAILRGEVLYDGRLFDRPAIEITRQGGELFFQDRVFDITLLRTEPYFVSRAGYKLAGFLLDYANGVLQDLEAFIRDFMTTKINETLLNATDIIHALRSLQIDECMDSNALDVGVGTGGFSEVLLACGARHITCVDVGDKLSDKLRADSRISYFGNCDIRDFARDFIENPHQKSAFDVIVCDVSFISLTSIVDVLSCFNARTLILLFKPQFEVGRAVKRNKKGVISDKDSIVHSLCSFSEILRPTHNLLFTTSHILGKEGNVEIFILATRKNPPK